MASFKMCKNGGMGRRAVDDAYEIGVFFSTIECNNLNNSNQTLEPLRESSTPAPSPMEACPLPQDTEAPSGSASKNAEGDDDQHRHHEQERRKLSRPPSTSHRLPSISLIAANCWAHPALILSQHIDLKKILFLAPDARAEKMWKHFHRVI